MIQTKNKTTDLEREVLQVGDSYKTMSGEYVVFLPKKLPGNSNVSGYEFVPKIDKTRASSEREAVSHILFRRGSGLSNQGAKRVMSILNKGGGADRYAAIIPEISSFDTDGKEIDYREDPVYSFAVELALKKGCDENPVDYVKRADELLRGVGVLPKKGEGWH